MLLSNVPLKKTRRSLWWAVGSYLTRWTIEETFRFIKQSYQLEDSRLLTYVRYGSFSSRDPETGQRWLFLP